MGRSSCGVILLAVIIGHVATPHPLTHATREPRPVHAAWSPGPYSTVIKRVGTRHGNVCIYRERNDRSSHAFHVRACP